MERGRLTFLLPLGALVFVAAVMQGLGWLFIAAGEEAAIGIGLALVLSVPAVAYFVARGNTKKP